MSYPLPRNTLAFQAKRPMLAHQDLSELFCSGVAQSVKAFLDDPQHEMAKPEECAIGFYLLNHAHALISHRRAPLEPLPDAEQALVEQYLAFGSKLAVRSLYYLLLICTRESRHVKSSASLTKTVAQKFGQPCAEFNQAIHGMNSTSAYQHFLANPPQVRLGPFVQSLYYIFFHGGFTSGYGGPAWGKVADCLVNFVTGHYTPEVMLDTIWTLSHNNGPIFNKHMTFNNYQSHASLLRILDVQRSGQVPELVLNDPLAKGWTHPDHRKVALKLKEMFPGEIGTYVDWYKVKALGGLGNYSSEQAKQLAQHGASPAAAEAIQKDKAVQAKQLQKEKQAKLQAQMAADDLKKNYYSVMPGVLAKKFQPARSA